MTIQWFPGHMAKARREITEQLKLIDIVIEIVDARIPLSSRNPMINELIHHKPRLMLLNKADLADEKTTKKWEHFFTEKKTSVLAVNAKTGEGMDRIEQAAKTLAKPLLDRMKKRGMRPRPIRALIYGIPNVGKSTVINRLASRRSAKVGDRPGVTKGQQWIKAGKSLELLDTPGILWPKFEHKMIGYKLAATGAIKDELIDREQVALYVLTYLQQNYEKAIKYRYDITDIDIESVELLKEIGKKRGCLLAGGEIDHDKTAEIILREMRAGTLGRISLEKPKE